MNLNFFTFIDFQKFVLNLFGNVDESIARIKFMNKFDHSDFYFLHLIEQATKNTANVIENNKK